MLLFPLPQVHAELGQVVLKPGLVGSKRFGLLREACPLVEKGRVVRRRGLAHPANELRIALGLGIARLAFGFEPPDLGGQAFEAVTAVLGDGATDLLDVEALAVPALRAPLDLRALPRPLFGEPRDALVQEVAFQPREEWPEGLAAMAELLDLGAERGVALAIGDERGEELDLAPRTEHRFVGSAQVVEMLDEGRNPGRHVERLQHVAAHELGEVPHRLHGDGLMEEIERLLVLDSEAAPEPCAIGREGSEDLHPGAAQALAQPVDVGAEARKLAGDGQIALRGGEEPLRLTLRVPDPEHLSQGHGLVVALVPEHAEDDGVVVPVAQGDGSRGDAEVAAFGLEVAEDVGAQGALAACGPGRPVVGRPVRRHEERGDRVHEGGLAGADVTGEEVVAAIEHEGPHLPVERPPVEDLQAVKAKARARLVRHEVEEQGLDFSSRHGRLPLPLPCFLPLSRLRSRRAPPGTRRDGRPARPATRRPRTP